MTIQPLANRRVSNMRRSATTGNMSRSGDTPTSSSGQRYSVLSGTNSALAIGASVVSSASSLPLEEDDEEEDEGAAMGDRDARRDALLNKSGSVELNLLGRPVNSPRMTPDKVSLVGEYRGMGVLVLIEEH